jgi:hypothetical protein
MVLGIEPGQDLAIEAVLPEPHPQSFCLYFVETEYH